MSSSTSRVRTCQIDEEQSGQRLDNYLLRVLKGAPRSLIYRIIRSGEVRVNGGRVKPMYRLETNDQVRIPPVSLSPPVIANPNQAAIKHIPIIYEDEELLIVDKPSGMAVHAGSGIACGLIELLRQQHSAKFLELAHRLDRETSGCLLLAKKRSSLVNLHQQLQHGDVRKYYQALVSGKWPKRLNKVTASLDTEHRVSGERHVRVHQDGKEATTTFQVLASYAEYTLMQASPKTGRTHQIRVHAAHSNHPIIGDLKYGDAQANLAVKKLGLKRLFLHAAGLQFTHPNTGQLLEVSSELPPELASLLDKL